MTAKITTSDLDAAWRAALSVSKHPRPPEGAMTVMQLTGKSGRGRSATRDQLNLAVKAGLLEAGEFYDGHTMKMFYWPSGKAKKNAKVTPNGKKPAK